MKTLKPAYLTGDEDLDSIILEMLLTTDRMSHFEEVYDIATEQEFLEIVKHYASPDDIYELSYFIDNYQTSLLLTQKQYWPIIKKHGLNSIWPYHDEKSDKTIKLPSYYTYVLHSLGLDNYSETLKASSDHPHAIPTNHWYELGTIAYSFKDAGDNILHCLVKDINQKEETFLDKDGEVFFTLQRLENTYSSQRNRLMKSEYVLEYVNPEYVSYLPGIFKDWYKTVYKDLPYLIEIYQKPYAAIKDFRPVDIFDFLDYKPETVEAYLKDHVANFNGPEPSEELS